MLAEKEEGIRDTSQISIHLFLRNEIHEKLFTNDEKRERERKRARVASMLMREISLSGRPISASYNISALGLRWINIEFMREVQNVYWARNLAGYTQPHTQNPDAWHTDSKLRK